MDEYTQQFAAINGGDEIAEIVSPLFAELEPDQCEILLNGLRINDATHRKVYEKLKAEGEWAARLACELVSVQNAVPSETCASLIGTRAAQIAKAITVELKSEPKLNG